MTRARRERYVDRRAEVKKRLNEIDEIVERANAQADLVDQAYLMQLAVIKLSGCIDHSVSHMMAGYLEENSTHRVLKFAKRQVDRLTNLNPTKLEQLLGGFDPGWSVAFKEFLEIDENKQSLENLIGARHKLAHGGDTKATPKALADYRKVAHETINLLFDMLLPLPAART